MYKTDPHQTKIYTNILSRVELNSEETRFHRPIEFIWKRRSNLHGKIFKGVAETYSPFINSIQETKDSKENTIVHSEGYLPTILDHLKLNLNFTITTSVAKQRYSWAHLVEQVGNGTYDIGETGFIFNPSRNDVVDFSFSVLPNSYTLAYVMDSDVLHLDVFLQPYHSNAWTAVWLYILILILGISTFALIFEKIPRPFILDQLARVLNKSTNFVLRSVVGKRINFEPNQSSTKVAFVFLIMNGFLLITCYRALLVASLTSQVATPPVTSLGEIVASKYLLALEKGGATEKRFLDAKPGSDENLLVKNRKITFISGSLESIMENMVNDDAMASATIFFVETIAVHYHEFYPCRLSEIKCLNQKGQGNVGMIYRKNWQFKDFLNYHLLVMKETGLMDKLYEPFLKMTKKSCPNKQLIRSVINKPNPVTINKTFSLYLIIFIGLIISSISLTLELLCKRCYV